jgi:hypothetical protein
MATYRTKQLMYQVYIGNASNILSVTEAITTPPKNVSASRQTLHRLRQHVQFGQARKCFNNFIELIRLIQNGACFKKYMLHSIQQMREINLSPVLFLSTHISEIEETPHVHHIII